MIKDKFRILLVTICRALIKSNCISNINILETQRIAELLRRLGHEVTMATLEDTDIAVAYEKINPNDFDKVLVMNGQPNFYGGKEDPYIIGVYEFLKKYDGVIYYLLMDLNLPFKQLYPMVKNRPWLKYKSEDEIRLDNEFVIISQSRNLDEAKFVHRGSDIIIKDVKHVPLNEWILHTNDFEENSKQVDLILGTGYRGGRRKEKYIEYFFGRDNISVEMFGSIKEDDFPQEEIMELKKPVFTGRIKNVEMLVKKNSTGFATVIIGDKNYNNNMFTLRMCESLLANSVVFIDEDFDPMHYFWGKFEFFYVKKGKELEEKIKKLKTNPELYKRVLEIQHKKVEELRKRNMPKWLNNVLS